VPVTFTCRGHGGISGTHNKSLEFTRDPSVTRRATCVLGVASDHDDRALRALRGDVEVTLTAAAASDTFRATITPFFLGDDSLVFRSGPALHGRTLGYDATKSAADIDRALVGALAHGETELSVSIRELGRGDRRGVLWVVALPIGNDSDLSPRARRVLEAADVILAEDTRRFRDLSKRVALSPSASVLSYHEHNEDARAAEVLDRLDAGARVALVSDAGTPLCSDPGYVVVHRAVDAGFDVTPVPGPSALLAVLSASGLPVDRFTYVGFLPRRAAARQAELRRLRERGDPFVVHEAPHRVVALLGDLASECADWRVCAGREVTKVFEEFLRGTPEEALQLLGEPRGEYTLVVAPPEHADATAHDNTAVDIDRLVRSLLTQGVTAKSIAHALAELPGLSRKEAYARVLAIAEQQ
jgi:16S rRNA (cytidine1402-2'-O)-methyltransferase